MVPHRLHPARRSLLVALAALVAAGALGVAVVRAGVFAAPAVADAAVEHGDGYVATVDGYRSWFGSYRLAGFGTVWCIDHGIAAPDVALGYENTDLAEHAPETRRALAWAVGRYGPGADGVDAAALMLVLHDLMGARYPSGPLAVDALDPAALGGFDGAEADVVGRARTIKADAVAHADLVGPFRLQLSADAVPAGDPGLLQARLVDAEGRPVAGVALHPVVTGAALTDAVDATTDADGAVAWSFEAGAGANTFAVDVGLPSTVLEAFAPTAAPAQRVARPALATVSAETAFEGLVRHKLTIRKHGDAEPELTVAGARFTVSGVAGEVTTGSDGSTAPVDVLPGEHVVTEVAPPPGYAPAGPWSVQVADDDVVLDVRDEALRGRLRIEKVDAVTGAPVTGARFRVDRLVAAAEPVEVADLGSLLPGRYRVTEVEAPPHYRLAAAVEAQVDAGLEAVVTVADVPTATLGFEKHPALAGARFEVRAGDETGAVVGGCTTGADGRCELPDGALDAGRPVCWTEVEAPPGWLPAHGACLTLGRAGAITTVRVDEQPVPPPAVPPAPAPPAPEVAVAAAPRAVRTEAPPTPVPAPAPAPELPRTGGDPLRPTALGLALVGLGLVLTDRFGGPGRPRCP